MNIIIMGVDPGSRITGFGIIELCTGKLRHLQSGCIRSESGNFTQRLKHIFHELQQVTAHYSPHEAAIEDVFYQRNAASALKLGQARGSAIAALAIAHCEIAEYSTRQIKQAVVGVGSASKSQIQHMVRVLLGLVHTPSPDASDALAVAICHAHMRESYHRLANPFRYRRGRLIGV